MDPCHVIAKAGDRYALCGAKDAYPHVLERHVPAHVAGREMTLCPVCEDIGAGRLPGVA